jgi:hypothetical protein
MLINIKDFDNLLKIFMFGVLYLMLPLSNMAMRVTGSYSALIPNYYEIVSVTHPGGALSIYMFKGQVQRIK